MSVMAYPLLLYGSLFNHYLYCFKRQAISLDK
jgi:hypothetical protein